jgi:NAD(P)-dependent dehydrogenase (short-subunit alcohol dehydrogenase family)
MTPTPLSTPDLKVVIVGNGAIGSAFCQAFLDKPETAAVALLGRREKAWTDSRVLQLPIDVTQPETVQAAAGEIAQKLDNVHVLINTAGVLHWDDHGPEKRVADLQADDAVQAYRTNALPVAILAQAFGPLLRRAPAGLFASLSARVGSIEDNKMGGWYSYRASKAAHNMLLRTVAREWAISHRQVAVVALHPGTVASPLSEPFVPKNYNRPVLQPQQSAQAMLKVLSSLTPKDSGSFFDWQGEAIPW